MHSNTFLNLLLVPCRSCNQAWGDYTTKVINYDYNYFVLLGMRLQLQLQYLSKVIN